jgi:hypothetical protein
MKKEKLFYLHLLVDLESFQSFNKMSQKKVIQIMGEGFYNLLIGQETHIDHWFNILNVQIRLNAHFVL